MATPPLASCRFRGGDDEIVTRESVVGNDQTEVPEGMGGLFPRCMPDALQMRNTFLALMPRPSRSRSIARACSLRRAVDSAGNGCAPVAVEPALRFRSITAAIAEGADHRLLLSSTLGEPVPLMTKMHSLIAMRSDAERVQIQHGAATSEVTIPVVEVH